MFASLLLLISPLLFTISADVLRDDDARIQGVCSIPHLPYGARIQGHSDTDARFAENETITIVCKQGEYPARTTKRTCRHGTWQGEHARCGQGVTVAVTKLEMFQCLDQSRPLLSTDVKQTIEPEHVLPINSFHFLRAPLDASLTVKGYDCYKWRLSLQEPTEIALLLIDVSSEYLHGGTNKPNLTVWVKHRTCKLQSQVHQLVDRYSVFGNYFYCDLDMQTDSTKLDMERYATDSIVIHIQWVAHRGLALDAVFIGKTYKQVVGNNRRVITDCGRLEAERAGVMLQKELGHVDVACNSSMVDVSPRVYRHRYICDANANWRGEWPKCVPRVVCSKQQITQALDDSVVVESVGNVYYTNDTHWEAIDYSWVSYQCASFDAFMLGKPRRVCFNGRWSNPVPRCTQGVVVPPNHRGWLSRICPQCVDFMQTSSNNAET